MSTQTTSWTHRPTADGHRRVAKRRIADERRLLAEVPLFGDLPARLPDILNPTFFQSMARIRIKQVRVHTKRKNCGY